MVALGASKLPLATNSSRSFMNSMNLASVETTAAAGRGTLAATAARCGNQLKSCSTFTPSGGNTERYQSTACLVTDNPRAAAELERWLPGHGGRSVPTRGCAAVRVVEAVARSGPAGIGAATFGKVQGLATEAAERSGSDAWKKVVKSYPTTTHARTVEYRLASKDALNKIFASADKSLRNGKPDEVTITE